MILGLEKVFANLGMSFETVILVITLIGMLPFYAKDFKIGVIIQFVFTGGLIMLFYQYGYNYTPVMYVFFMTLIVMTLSLYATNKVADKGGIV